MTRVVAIHQPNFFPWLGYFAKIQRADTFIFLDDVQFQKTGGMWCNRVKCLIASEARWVTASIDRSYAGVREIREMRFLSKNPWRGKMLKSLQMNYCRHPFFEETFDFIVPLIRNEESNVSEYNIAAVTAIATKIGLRTDRIRRSSEFNVEASSNELLCRLTRLAAGDTYMCGGGAEGYQDGSVFRASGVKLLYQNFKHPIYTQHGRREFVPGLSIVDALMNLGFDGVRDLLSKSGQYGAH